MAIKNKGISILERIKSQAKKDCMSNQTAQQLFFQEEFLRKLSKSKFKENMILKGGMFIYTLTDYGSRPTKDMDFMIKQISNEIDNIKNVIEEICLTDTGNNFVKLDVIDTKKIILTKKYPGVRIKLMGRIENVKVPFFIDIGIDDIIWPKPVLRKIKTRLIDFKEPEIYTYSLESTIAEKFDAILSLMELTSRMKDFYDIYYLSDIFSYDGKILYEAIQKTIIHRNRIIEKNYMERIKSFKDNSSMKIMWENYEPSKISEISFAQAINRIEEFLGPIFVAIISNEVFSGTWSIEKKKWEK